MPKKARPRKLHRTQQNWGFYLLILTLIVDIHKSGMIVKEREGSFRMVGIKQARPDCLWFEDSFFCSDNDYNTASPFQAGLFEATESSTSDLTFDYKQDGSSNNHPFGEGPYTVVEDENLIVGYVVVEYDYPGDGPKKQYVSYHKASNTYFQGNFPELDIVRMTFYFNWFTYYSHSQNLVNMCPVDKDGPTGACYTGRSVFSTVESGNSSTIADLFFDKENTPDYLFVVVRTGLTDRIKVFTTTEILSPNDPIFIGYLPWMLQREERKLTFHLVTDAILFFYKKDQSILIHNYSDITTGEAVSLKGIQYKKEPVGRIIGFVPSTEDKNLIFGNTLSSIVVFLLTNPQQVFHLIEFQQPGAIEEPLILKNPTENLFAVVYREKTSFRTTINYFKTDSTGCEASCKYCSKPSSDSSCITCNPSSLTFVPEGENGGKCLSGESCLLTKDLFTITSKTCRVGCKAGCKKCDGNYACIECQPDLILLSGRCLNTCPTGYYFKESSGACLECDADCQECQNSSSECTKCFPVNTSDKNQYLNTTTNTCSTSCPAGFTSAPKSGICEECSSLCSNGCLTKPNDCGLPCDLTQFFSTSDGTCNATCEVGEYGDPVDRQCKTCPAGCATCSSSTQCLTCTTTSEVALHGVCQVSCPDGYFDQSKVCIACNPNCLTCSSSGCLTCRTHYSLYANECVLGCPHLTVQNPTNFICEDCNGCPGGCETDPTTCLVASVISLPAFPGSLVDCEDGQYWITGEYCHNCEGLNCKTCDVADSTKCLTCMDDFVKIGDDCKVTCPEGTMREGLLCTPCADAGCKRCHKTGGTEICLECIGLYEEATQSCVAVSACPNFTTPQVDQCLPCSLNCDGCTNSPGNCDNCVVGYHKLNSECIKTCPIGYSQLPDTDSADCVLCSGCVECKAVPTECTKCLDTEYLVGDACVTTAPICAAGTGMNSLTNLCQTCIDYCIDDCDPLDYTVCTSCVTAKYYFYGDRCYKSCPGRTYYTKATAPWTCIDCPDKCLKCNIGGCIVCDDGKFMLNIARTCIDECPANHLEVYPGYCMACTNDCATCETLVTTCVTCISGKYFYKKKCMVQCPSGYTQSPADEICLPCNYKCTTCGDTPDVCTSCADGLFYENDPIINCIASCTATTQTTIPETRICEDCSGNCETCSKRPDYCITCKAGFMFSDDSSHRCVDLLHCPAGTSSTIATVGGTCTLCDAGPECLDCAVVGTCDLCRTAYVSFNGVCVETCPSGYSINSYSQECLPCPPGCHDCTISSMSCLTCKPGFIKDTTHKCFKPENLLAGFFMDTSDSFKACGSYCLACLDENTCVLCRPGRFLKDKKCTTSGGTYYVVAPVNGVLEKCVGCYACEGYPTHCTRCFPEYNLFENSCFKECPHGYYGYGAICKKCHEDCDGCTGSAATHCLRCAPEKFYYPYGKTCVDECPRYSVQNPANHICVKCGVNCNECGATPNTCTKCSGYYLFGDSCLPKCPDGYMNIGYVCVPCQTPCATCASKVTQCYSCVVGTFLTGYTCGPCLQGQVATPATQKCSNCESPCLTCENWADECVTCRTGYKFIPELKACISVCTVGTFLLNGECAPCDGNCFECDITATQCLSCASPLLLDAVNQACVSTCQAGETTTPINGICEVCHEDCETCSDSSSSCLSCKAEFGLFKQSCVDSCPAGTYEDPTSNVCVICENCLTCEGDNVTCTSCISPKVLDLQNNTCVDECGPGTTQNPNNFICENCSDGCVECLYTSSYCTECDGAEFSIRNTCVTVCPTGTSQIGGACIPCSEKCLDCAIDDIAVCSRCIDGFYLDGTDCIDECPITKTQHPANGVCQICSPHCKSCYSDGSTCSECEDGLLLNVNLCVTVCPEGKFANGAGDECLECDFLVGCKTCEDTAGKCLTCLRGWKYKDNQCLQECDNKEITYPDNGLCETCTPHCDVCEDTKFGCLKCEEGFHKEKNNCVAKCSAGYTQSLASGICTKCSHNCDTCLDRTHNCSSCIEDKFYIDDIQRCSTTCDWHYSRLTHNPTNKICEFCNENCSRCNERADLCTKCRYGYYLYGETCVKDCPYGTTEEPTNYTCEPCINCARCRKEPQICITCPTPPVDLLQEYLFEDTCLQVCPRKHFIDSSGPYLECTHCHEDCETCDGTKQNECLTCPPEDLSYLTLAHKRCYELGCPPRFYDDGTRTCLACHESCFKCSGPAANQCLHCPSNETLLYQGVCGTDCVLGTYAGNAGGDANRIPTKTDEDLDLIPDLHCFACDGTCKECFSGLPSGCTKCFSEDNPTNPIFFNNQCLAECPPGYYNSIGEGTNTCELCDPNCATCSGTLDHCDSCYEGYKIIEGFECKKLCLEGWAWTKRDTCEQCSQNCLRCEDVTLECILCKENFEVNKKNPAECFLLPVIELEIKKTFFVRKSQTLYLIFEEPIKNKDFNKLLQVFIVGEGEPEPTSDTPPDTRFTYNIERISEKTGIRIKLIPIEEIPPGRIMIKNTGSRTFESARIVQGEEQIDPNQVSARVLQQDKPVASFLGVRIAVPDLTILPEDSEETKYGAAMSNLKRGMDWVIKITSILMLIIDFTSGMQLIRLYFVLSLIRFLNLAFPSNYLALADSFKYSIIDFLPSFFPVLEERDNCEVFKIMEKNDFDCYMMNSGGSIISVWLIYFVILICLKFALIAVCEGNSKYTFRDSEESKKLRKRNLWIRNKIQRWARAAINFLGIRFFFSFAYLTEIKLLISVAANMRSFMRSPLSGLFNSLVSGFVTAFYVILTVYQFNLSSHLEKAKKVIGTYGSKVKTSTLERMKFLKEGLKNGKSTGSFVHQFYFARDMLMCFFVLCYPELPYNQVIPCLILIAIPLSLMLLYRPFESGTRNLIVIVNDVILLLLLLIFMILEIWKENMKISLREKVFGYPLIFLTLLLLSLNYLYNSFIIGAKISLCLKKFQKKTTVKKEKKKKLDAFFFYDKNDDSIDKEALIIPQRTTKMSKGTLNKSSTKRKKAEFVFEESIKNEALVIPKKTTRMKKGSLPQSSTKKKGADFKFEESVEKEALIIPKRTTKMKKGSLNKSSTKKKKEE